MRRTVFAALGTLAALAGLAAPVVAAPHGGSASFSVTVTSCAVANVSVQATARGASVVGNVERSPNGSSTVGLVRLAQLHRGELLEIVPIAQGEAVDDPRAAFDGDAVVVASAT